MTTVAVPTTQFATTLQARTNVPACLAFRETDSTATVRTTVCLMCVADRDVFVDTTMN